MLSSTSSSNQRLPHLAWLPILGGGLLMLVVAVIGLESGLALRGFQANLSDSSARWAVQRARASSLGTRALILVGDSQVLQDLDLPTLRRETGLEPVQLAIAGSSFLPVLQGLADDPEIRGTVLLGFDPGVVGRDLGPTPSTAYEADYERNHRTPWPDFHRSEQFLTDMLHAQLRSYADGARPLTSLLSRVLKQDPVQQYVFVSPDRGEYSDFSRAPLPALYYHRALNNLPDKGTRQLRSETPAQLDIDLPGIIAAIPAEDDALFLERMRDVDALGRRIEARGGRMLYVDFPTSGYVRDIGDRRFPRRLFWDRFAAYTRSTAVESEDVPAIRALRCPDGTHLDHSDQVPYTLALLDALHFTPAQ